ncbi:MAG: hypothetical protein EOO89_16585, partial [Pedobacter sp.]
MRNLRVYFFVILTFVIGSAFVISADPIDQIVSSLEKFTSSQIQEKVFVHTDKPFYAAGDTIWYKAYTVDARENLPTNLSGVLYVDLLNEKDSVFSSQRIKLIAGMGNAQIALPIDIKPGNYTMYAYTNWMKNYDRSFFFKKQFTIANPFAKEAALTTAGSKDVELGFFPEGGDLVAGIRSVIAFKAAGADGMGINLKGNIVDEAGQKVIDFSTEHFGMGITAMVPEAGKKYMAQVTEGPGAGLNIALPLAKTEGYVLAVRNRDTAGVTVKVTASAGLVSDKELLLVLQSNGEIQHVTKFKSQQVSNILVPRSKLTTGIVQLTLFSGTTPLAERLIFINQDDQLRASITSNKTTYATREATELDLKVLNKAGQPVLGSFSVSVVDEEKVKSDEQLEENILTNLLLTSELKGTIEKPGYYFNKKNEEAGRHLDALLLTQGW